jgi:hypothetical protein
MALDLNEDQFKINHQLIQLNTLNALSLGGGGGWGGGRETPYRLNGGLECTGVLAMRVRQNRADRLFSRYPPGFGIAGRGGSGGSATAPLLLPPAPKLRVCAVGR